MQIDVIITRDKNWKLRIFFSSFSFKYHNYSNVYLCLFIDILSERKIKYLEYFPRKITMGCARLIEREFRLSMMKGKSVRVRGGLTYLKGHCIPLLIRVERGYTSAFQLQAHLTQIVVVAQSSRRLRL